jgi:hypothetical protein
MPVQATLPRDLQIDDCIALFADEVVVFGDIRVKAVEGAAERNPADQALLDENPDVSVNSSYAEVGELLLQPSEQPVCGGMGVSRSQQSKNSFSLLASSIGRALVGFLAFLCHWAVRSYPSPIGTAIQRALGIEPRGHEIITLRPGSPWKRRDRSAPRNRRSACAGSRGCSGAPANRTPVRAAPDLSTLSMIRAAMRAGSPGARPFWGSSIRRKAYAGFGRRRASALPPARCRSGTRCARPRPACW